jgi:hypothetical protein
MATDSNLAQTGEAHPLGAVGHIVPEAGFGASGPERKSSIALYRAAIMVILAAGVGLVVAALDVTRP